MKLNGKDILVFLKGEKGDTGAKLVKMELQGKDENGGNVYLMTFDNGTTAQFVAPKGSVDMSQYEKRLALLEFESGIITLNITDGQFYGSNGNIAPNASYETATVDVSNFIGETLIITAWANLATRCLFFAADGGVIEAWTSEGAKEKVVPEGAVTLAISNEKANGSMSVAKVVEDETGNAEIAALTEKVIGLESGYNEHEEQIDTLTEKVIGLESEHDEHEERIAALENGLGGDSENKPLKVLTAIEDGQYFNSQGGKVVNAGWENATANIQDYIGDILSITAYAKTETTDSDGSDGSDGGIVIVREGDGFYYANGETAEISSYERATVDVRSFVGDTLEITAYATLSTRCLFFGEGNTVIEAWASEGKTEKVVPEGAVTLAISNEKAKGFTIGVVNLSESGSEGGNEKPIDTTAKCLFLNVNNAVLEEWEQTGKTEKVVPEGAVTLAVSNEKAKGEIAVFNLSIEIGEDENPKITALETTVARHESDISTLEQSNDEHEERIAALENGGLSAEQLDKKADKEEVFGGFVELEKTIEDGKFYYASGETANNASFQIVNVDVSGVNGVELTISCYCYGSARCHFFNASGAILETFQHYVEDNSATVKVVPEGAATLGISNMTSKLQTVSVGYIKRNSLAERVSGLEEKHAANKMKLSLKPYKVSFNGDSITEGYIPQGKYSYVPFVVENLMIGEHENNGKSGQSIGYIRTTAQKTTDADIITVFAGTNNLSEGMNISAIKSEFIGMYETFKANNPDHADKLFLLITPIKRFDVEESLALRLEEIVDMIVEVGKEQKIPVMDLWHFGGIEKHNETKYFVDHIHPNETGARYLAEIISEYIEKCLLIKTLCSGIEGVL